MSSDPLRVCFIAGTLDAGGAERQLFNQLHALVNQGVAAEVISFGDDDYWELPITDLGVSVISLKSFQSVPMRLLMIVRHLRRHRPRYVQAVHFYTNLYVTLAARLCGSIDYGVVQSDGVFELRAHSLLGRRSLLAPSWIVTNSRRSLATVRRLGVRPGKLRLLPNVVDTQRFCPGDERKSDTLRIACIGRMIPEKRFDRLLLIIEGISQRLGGNLRVVIAGDGPERPNIEQRAAEMKLVAPVVSFVGATEHPERIYQNADIFLFVSDHEGSPNVVLEAMSSGLTVVAEAVNGIRELVQHGRTGIVASRFDPAATIEQVVELSKSQGERYRLGHTARQWVVQNRSLHVLHEYQKHLYDL